MKCRHCRTPLDDARDVFIDLGAAPPSNAFLREADLGRPELHFPLKVMTCPECRLVQVDEVQRHDALFASDYVYFSSYSRSWLAHARRYVAQAVERLSLGPASRVMEVASNDGYLLQYVAERGIPCVGVEPTSGTAEAARARGIETLGEFFGRDFGRRFAAARGRVDLVLGNNVLAHVPDINDFVAGLRRCSSLAASSRVEFPHLLRLIGRPSSTPSTTSISPICRCAPSQRIFAAQGLKIFDVEELPTHGGSLRVLAPHARPCQVAQSAEVAARLAEDAAAGFDGATYRGLAGRASTPIKNDLLAFLIEQQARGQHGRRLRRCRQGQHTAQLLPACGTDLMRVRRRRIAAQAGTLPAGFAHSRARPRGAARVSPGLRADPALEPARGDRRRAGCGARLGRAVRDRGARAAGLLAAAPRSLVRAE